MSKEFPSGPERRSFLTRFNKGAAALAALAMGGRAMAQVKLAPGTRWEPTRHDKDDWLDEIPGKHRLMIDTTSADAFRDALLYTGNFILANRTDYGLENSELANVIVARHQSTAFAYTDAMWAKYGVPISARANFVDPKTKEAPKVNVHSATLETLAKQGVRFAVCSMATRNLSGLIAKAVNGDADAIAVELGSNLVSNARLVPAGIVAISRGQERGYSVVTA